MKKNMCESVDVAGVLDKVFEELQHILDEKEYTKEEISAAIQRFFEKSEDGDSAPTVD